VIFRSFKCRKFGRLLSEREDRDLSVDERSFMARHGQSCPSCGREEEAGSVSLNLLRSIALDAAPAEHFDERLLRRAKIVRVRESLSYWSPAFAGGAVAVIALFATLHILTLQPAHSQPTLQNGQGFIDGEARLDRPVYPELELQHLPRLAR